MLNRCIVRSAMILAIAVSAGASANAQNAVKVGMVMPMTGGLAAAGQQVVGVHDSGAVEKKMVGVGAAAGHR